MKAKGDIMGTWMEAYIESKNAEPDYLCGEGKITTRKCLGFADRKGKCQNTVRNSIRVYCDECIAYYKSGEWHGK